MAIKTIRVCDRCGKYIRISWVDSTDKGVTIQKNFYAKNI